ncbi:unnamed protein product [Peniophora sp. CBMAI 1063]|nr:unnamed protein product [Peniophora sp. CBMAI 1063]
MFMPSPAVAKFRVCLLWHCLFIAAVYTQNFTIPSNWQSTVSSTKSQFSKAQCEQLASGGAETIAGFIDVDTGSISVLDAITTAGLAAVLTLQDYYSGNQTWKDQVLQEILGKYSAMHPTYSDGAQYGTWSPDTLHFGLAAYYAYRAYNDSTALQLAVTNWELAYADFMTAQRAQAGTFPGASNFTSNCSAKSVGGVFTRPPMGMNAEMSTDSSGMMISLSGYLYNATRNATYLETAELGATFMQSNAYHPGNPIPAGINASDCTIQDPNIFSWNTGLYIQGMAVLASITGNTSYSNILNDLVGLAGNASWTSTEDGHMTEYFPSSSAPAPFNAYKGVYIRALAEVIRLNPGSAMAEFIQAYIISQLHAVTQSAYTAGTNFYSTDWNGPPATGFDALGSIAALDVLNPAFALSSFSVTGSSSATTASSMPSTSGTLTTSASPDSGSRHGTTSSSVGGIVGGVVGGMAGCTLLVLAMLCVRRYKRQGLNVSHARPSQTAPSRKRLHATSPEPYMLEHPGIVRVTKGGTGAIDGTTFVGSASGPSRWAGESTTSSRTLPEATGGDPRDMEATLSDFVNRIQRLRAMVYTMPRHTSDEQPPQYTD